MKAINRLFESNISKYKRYIDKLIKNIDSNIGTSFKPMVLSDSYTYKYVSDINKINGELKRFNVMLELTTNRTDIEDGILWGTFMIGGRKYDIGELFGNIKDDTDIIEDTWYDFFEQLGRHNEKLPVISIE